MITLRIGKLLEDNGFGQLSVDEEVTTNGIFLEQMPQGATGVAVFSRGAPMGKGMRLSQAFDIYSRGLDNVEGYQKLENIAELMRNSLTVCTLPIVEYVSEEAYNHCSIVPVSFIENAGIDENDRVVYMMTAQITYNREIV
jgi:hypothetical protein